MKIFGNTRIQGRIAADTGSFKVYGIMAGETIPKAFVAGTDAVDGITLASNRSVVAHGQYDYIVTSQDSGLNFDTAALVAGRVMGYRVQHVASDLIYALRTNIDNNANNDDISSIVVSRDGGLTFKKSDKDDKAYKMPKGIIAFDMMWTSLDEGFVVGAKMTFQSNPNNIIRWKKYTNYGLTVNSSDAQSATLVILKKEANSSTFVEWGTPPTVTGNDAITAIAINPSNKNIIIIGTQEGRIYKSIDGGLTWQFVSLIGAYGTCVNRIKFVDGNSSTVYAVGQNASIYRSTSGGDYLTWSNLNSTSNPLSDTRGPLILLTRDSNIPDFNDILLPNSTDVIVVGDDHTRVLKSSDSGATWKFVSSGIYSDYAGIQRVKSIRVNATNFYVAVSKNKLFIARNPDITGGADIPNQLDWYEVTIPDEVIDLQLVVDDNPEVQNAVGYAHILTKNGVYEYWLNNNKLSTKRDFSSITSEVPVRLFSHSYREIYIVTADSKIIRGTKYLYNFDKEFTFVEETSGLTSENIISLNSARTGRIFGGSSTGKIIYKDTGSIVNDTTYSTDPVTWTQTSTNPTASVSNVIQVQALDNDIVFALLEDADSRQVTLFKSEDIGVTWSQLYVYPEAIKNFVAYDVNRIYAMTSNGSKLIFTTDSFSNTTTTTFAVTQTSVLADVFDIDTARSTDESSIIFLLGGSFGVRATTTTTTYPNVGPWTDNSWTLISIAGEDKKSYWIGGGTTFAASRAGDTTLGSEPILLTSTDGGENWTNAISRVAIQEPPNTGDSGGDFPFTSISEGKYFIPSNKDVFNIYSSDNKGTTFESYNSNLFVDTPPDRTVGKYPGNSDGIRKIRFYDDKFGVAVSDIVQEDDENAKCKISITKDGGQTWAFSPGSPVNYNFNSVFITTQSQATGEYEIYATAYPTSLGQDGYVFISKDSGLNWMGSLGWAGVVDSTDGQKLQPLDVFFVDNQTGFVSVKGGINTSPSVEGIYRTTDGGTTWNLVTITDFAAGNTRGHIQFITKKKGFVAGAYGSNNSSGLFKTTDSGSNWTRITTNYDATADKPITAMHFLSEAVGVIGVGSEIWRTINSGSSWSKVHDLSLTGVIHEIKFAANGQYGLAVGHYNSNSGNTGEHFVLKSLDSGSTWADADPKHTYIDLEFELDAQRNLIGQPSTLYTVAFAEQIILSDESKSIVDPRERDDLENAECINSQFISASWYNYGNFAYRCNPTSSTGIGISFRYHPNFSNNIGLGSGIFGQRTNIDVKKLKNLITYGAALGVGALGKAEYSLGDTATGFGAMDQVKNGINNVAIGYKALSLNKPDNILNLAGKSNLNSQETSSILGVTKYGGLLLSSNGGNSWTIQAEGPSTNSYATSSMSGPVAANKVYNSGPNQIFVLLNASTASAQLKTAIQKYNLKTGEYVNIYTSSVYTINQLQFLTPSNVLGLDTGSGVFFRSVNGPEALLTGSISSLSGNSLKSFKMNSQTLGFIVGSKIWKLQSGSQTAWETSSYSGSHTLNAIDYVNSNIWIAVGTSGSIYRTTNKGTNWNYISTGTSGSTLTTNDLFDVKVIGAKIIVAGNSGSILIGTNNGTTWKTGSFAVTGSAYGKLTEITVLDGNTSFIKHETGNLKSIDGGNTWIDSTFSTPTDELFSDESTIISIVSSKYSANEIGKNPNYNVSADKILLEDTIPTTPENAINENTAVGAYSLYSFGNASKIVAIGANSFKNLSSNKSKVYPPLSYEDFTRPQNGMPDLVIGSQSIKTFQSFGQVAVGSQAQYTSENSSYNTSVGYATMYDSINANYNTALGFYSQHVGHNNRNTSVGAWSLGWNGNLNKFVSNYSASMRGGDDNVAIGYKALFNNLDSIRARQIIRDAGGVDRTVNHIDESAWLTIPYTTFNNLGSRNIAIGNYSFLNASGSADTIVMGYRAVSDRGYDITDSVFIGSYVGEKFGTKIGTYYSSSSDNDWKFTQTVAVGTRALQNQIGYDIVAIGANVLRGTQTGGNAANPDITISTDPFGVLAAGFYNSKILSRTDFSDFDKRIWSVNNYIKLKPNDYYLYDNMITGAPQEDSTGATPFNSPRAISVVTRNTAYAVIKHSNPTGIFPLIVKTDNLSKTKSDVTIDWTTVQPGPIENFGSIVGKDIDPFAFDVTDENTMYLMIKSVSGKWTDDPKASTSVILKATSPNKFTRPSTQPITFSKLDLPVSLKLRDMHFASNLNGIAIGRNLNEIASLEPKHYITTDGGVTWASASIDTSTSGSNVGIYSVWMSEDGTTAYACGDYGSIYKYTSGGGVWTKQLGASSNTRLGGTFWDTVLMTNNFKTNEKVSVPVYFATRNKTDQSNIVFLNIKFLPNNPSVGYAIGRAPLGFLDAPFSGPSGYQIVIAKTTDGGSTWQHKQTTLPEMCPTIRRTSLGGESTPMFTGNQALAIIDQNKVVFGLTFGLLGYTTDGGTTWKYSDSIWGSSTFSNSPCGCKPFPQTYCLDYKQFEGSTITISGSAFEDIVQTVAIGSEAQAKMPAVNNNVAIGYKAQFNGTGSASGSVQIGANVTLETNSAFDTVAIGMDSLEKIQYTYKNTAVGRNTLNNLVQPNSTPRAFPAPGIAEAGGEPRGVTDGTTNTVVGFEAGTSLIAGDKNVFIGANSGMQLNAPAVKTWGYNNIIIGTNAAKSQYNMANQVAIGNQEITSYIAWGVPNVNGWAWQSDARDKTDTGSFNIGLNFIRQIQPKEFKWDPRFNYATGSPDGTHKQSGSSYGYIAQDLEAAANSVGVSSSLFILGASGSYSGSMSETGSFDIKLIRPSMVNLIAVNAIKELDTTVSYLSSSKYTTFLGDETASSYPVTHSLGTRDVIAMVYNTFTNAVVYPSMSIDSTNTMTVTFNGTAQLNEYRLTIIR